MHFHIVLGNTDGDILHWKNSLPQKTFSHFVREILSAERRRRIAVVPLPEQRGIVTGHIETHIRIQDKQLTQFLMAIPKRKRAGTVKNIIRKHIAANYRRLELEEQSVEMPAKPSGAKTDEKDHAEDMDDYRKMLLQISGG